MTELRVVATAGHVDHGKSSLIVRLTGIDPDRWVEEKRRGLTIDLGYAWCELPSGREVGFVDVPGHERFVANMLAGVGPVRLVLFVVAANEGWRPQSEEHLAILDVLGVDGGVVALTKRDLVDEVTMSLARGGGAGAARGHGPLRRQGDPRLRHERRGGSTSSAPRSTRSSRGCRPRRRRAHASSSTACSRSPAPARWRRGPCRATVSRSARTSSCTHGNGRLGSVRSRPTSGARTARAR